MFWMALVMSRGAFAFVLTGNQANVSQNTLFKFTPNPEGFCLPYLRVDCNCRYNHQSTRSVRLATIADDRARHQKAAIIEKNFHQC